MHRIQDKTRVVLKSENDIEDYEYEGKNNNLIKNNIYLGKVSRIEPSLQAAFVDFGREDTDFYPLMIFKVITIKFHKVILN